MYYKYEMPKERLKDFLKILELVKGSQSVERELLLLKWSVNLTKR